MSRSASHMQTTPAGIARAGAHPLAGLPFPACTGLRVSPGPDAARFILRGGSQAITIAGEAFGIRLPMLPNRAAESRDTARAALWLGPDEWLLMAPGEQSTTIAPTLEEPLARHPHSLVDVSHRQVSLILEGQLARRVLSAGCPLDLRPAAFPVGMATRTLFMKAEIVLWRQQDDRFLVEVWRSFAPYLAGHLAEAAGDCAAAAGIY